MFVAIVRLTLALILLVKFYSDIPQRPVVILSKKLVGQHAAVLQSGSYIYAVFKFLNSLRNQMNDHKIRKIKFTVLAGLLMVL